jgi:transitional endoplasmic reticulum ATPase
MISPVAEITYDFSFAYIQEGFVAALLALARKAGPPKHERRPSDGLMEETADGWLEIKSPYSRGGGDGHDELKDVPLWNEFKEQVRILRDSMGDKKSAAGRGKTDEADVESLEANLEHVRI